MSRWYFLIIWVVAFLVSVAQAENGMTVLDPDYFDRLEGSENLGNAGDDEYACQRFTGSSHTVMTSTAFRKIKKSCGGDLVVQHIQPRKRFVPMNEWKQHETGYLLVCCRGKARSRRSFSRD
ncbi:MAG: hypothetical protein H6617_04150 [Bdellovibrionaceae bacterium]|nr:hypothetical protein [Bdellovibrionales bacterium]MCB9253851.1 hypothetical protein [Pseudobdellovibrionaceae bacterium]